MRKIYRFVLTGGPCAGKTTAIQKLKEHFSDRYVVLCVPESSTELMTGGILPTSFLKPINYMVRQTKLQLLKESIYDKAAEELLHIQTKDIIILYDRGLMDIKAYMTEDDFNNMLDFISMSQDSILTRYMSVFHLVSTAVELPTFYTTSNNEIRKETIDEASIIDDLTYQAWKGHKDLVVIEGKTDFKQKIELLISKIKMRLI